MPRSVKPSVWIEKRRAASGYTTYRVRREKDGRRLPDIMCGPDRAHAQRVQAREQERLWGRRLRLRAAEDMAFADWVTLDLRNREHKMAATTQRHTRRAYDLLAEHLGPGARLGAVDREEIREFVPWLLQYDYTRAGGRAYKSERAFGVNGALIYLRALKAGLRRALKDGKLEEDPFFGVELPAEVFVANPPEDDELAAIWTKLSPQARRALTVFLGLGLRRSELLSCTPRSISEIERPGEDGKPRLVRYLKAQKAKTRRGTVEFKVIAIPDDVWAAMQPVPKDPNAPLFSYYPSSLSSIVSKAARAAGLTDRFRLHDMRHRWASRLMRKVKNRFAVKQAGGWTTDAAMSRYQHEAAEFADVTLQQGAVAPPALPQNAARGRRGKRGSPSEPSR